MTECAKCGVCCIDISIKQGPEHIKAVLDHPGFDMNDPRSKDYIFIDKYWTYDGPDSRNGHQYQCTKFNHATRLCEAHDERPLVCSRFPYYDKEPQPSDAEWLPPQCSYTADVRKMLPLFVV